MKKLEHKIRPIHRQRLCVFVCTILGIVTLESCNSNKNSFDASGSFEAVETIISAESNGVIKTFNIEEGQSLTKGEIVGYIDSLQLTLKKEQLLAQIGAINSRQPDIYEQTQSYDAQIATLKTQLSNAISEQKRLQNLVRGDAATPKQLDDATQQVHVLNKQISAVQAQKNAQKSVLETSSKSISDEQLPVQVQIKQIKDQLDKAKIINPMDGTVLAKYAEENEVAQIGQPLYKIADLSTIILRVYISGNQLSKAKLNQKVTVSTDDGDGGFKQIDGVIVWISDKAEFTPKTIQTKDERANLVYATKVKVQNDGSYKIGMYGEIKF